MSAPWEGEELVQPLSADEPCGANLEDTQLLASFDAFRLFGQARPPDAPPEPGETRTAPDWSEIRKQALEALQKSRDLRLLAHLGTAVLRTDGLSAFCKTVGVAAKWLDRYWAQTYPLLDDPILRRNALNCLADQMAVVEGLRRMPLVRSRQHGDFSLRDIEIASGQMPPTADGGPKPQLAQLNAAFATVPLEDLTAEQATIAEALAALKRIDGLMRAEGGPEAAPSFEPLSTQLSKIDRVLRTQMALRPGGGNMGTDPGAEMSQTVAEPMTGGVIRSRQDAIRALDAVADFFRKTEPSSPVPLFVDRAKRLVSKDFLEVLADVAPDAVAHVKAAGGLKQGE